MKDQQEDKEGSSQGWTNLRGLDAGGLEERDAGKVGSSLPWGLQDRQVGDGKSRGWCGLTVWGYREQTSGTQRDREPPPIGSLRANHVFCPLPIISPCKTFLSFTVLTFFLDFLLYSGCTEKATLITKWRSLESGIELVSMAVANIFHSGAGG